MRTLFPPIEPFQKHSLAVDDIHTLYIEEVGTLDGIPALFLHGGPGSGCESYHRQFFDPNKYRVVLFDQRGAGRSTPHADLTNNTTQDLIADIEKIRQHLGIEKWVVFGGSWGSTLALVYAQTHPEVVSGLILRGIFLCRPQEIAWFYQSGADKIFPDYWEDFIAPIAEDERHDMVTAYYKQLTSENEMIRTRAAKAWSIWEGRTATLMPRTAVLEHFGNVHTALSLARIECHYFMHNSFLRDNQILEDVDKLKDIPGVIVQGRYDVICPMQSAWQLHQTWPMSDLNIIPDAGHSASEAGITDALLRATHDMVLRIT